MEEDVAYLHRNGIAVDLVTGFDSTGTQRFGVRLRTIGKQLPKDLMTLGAGRTFQEALEDAKDTAAQGRWERVSWPSRPWATNKLSDIHALGLDKAL